MKRQIYSSLLDWKFSKYRKPLLLYGARQVGKTYILKELGKNEYKNAIYISFDRDSELHGYFAGNISPKQIIGSLTAHFRQEIIPGETLLIFDEIQECQRAKDSLKYFNEDAPEYHIVAAGSYLGVSSGKFPVGQVDILTLHPLTFSEFLEATGNDILREYLQTGDLSNPAMHILAVNRLKEYFYVGGMPEAVKIYAETDDLMLTRQTHDKILSTYKNDFQKHISAHDIPKVRMLWDSIPIHLAKEKKKFVYREIKQGGRAAEFENAMNWLIHTGLVHKVYKTEEAKTPLVAYEDRNAFKLFMHDIGLLSAIARLDIKTFFDTKHDVFTEFKGALAEQFVLQELKINSDLHICYWVNGNGKAEVDFVIQHDGDIIPVEVKSGAQTKAKSLGVYLEKRNPPTAIRASLQNYAKHKNIIDVPLYAIGRLFPAQRAVRPRQATLR